jgi:hypothetical protein
MKHPALKMGRANMTFHKGLFHFLSLQSSGKGLKYNVDIPSFTFLVNKLFFCNRA